MFIRPIFRSDLPAIEDIRERSQYMYDKFSGPDLFGPQIEAALVLTDSTVDRPRIVIAAKKVTELYAMVMDHEWNFPAMRMAGLSQLHQEMKKKLLAKGYDEAYCFLEPSVPEGYTHKA